MRRDAKIGSRADSTLLAHLKILMPMRRIIALMLCLAATSSVLVVVSYAMPTAVTTPTVNLISEALVSPSAAWSFYGSATAHTNGPGAWTTTPPEIKALARALGGSGRLSTNQFAQNVFDYVRNNIEVEFRFGAGKGGRGALIDQSGTPFDQADLMVRLLRAGGVTANYQIGTVALTAQQFGQWTGLIINLNQSLQTFDVDAKAACQFLADGGMPAIINGASSCASLSGNLPTTGTPIQMVHIWVSANSKLYDPSFKAHVLNTGVDVSAAMGCGTASAPTCGSGIVTAGMTGATTGSDSTGNYIQNFNGPGAGGLNAKLQTFATTLQSYIQGTNRLASLQDIVGGPQLVITPSPLVSGTLPYVTATTATWTDIPDQFRTKLRVRMGTIYADRAPSFSNGDAIDQTFFADDIAGRRVQAVNGSPSMVLMVDSTSSSAPACASSVVCPNGTVVLDVDHPYAANGGNYGDESNSFAMPGVSTDYTTGTLPITIVHELGNASEATDQHVAAYQETNPTGISQGITLINGGSGSGGFVMQSTYENNNQAILAGKLLGQGSAADRVIAGLGQARVTRHHDIGIVYAAPYDPSSTCYMSISTALSVNTNSSASAMRSPVFETEAATWVMLEGAVNAQVQGMKNSLWAGFFFNTTAKIYQTGTTTTGTLTSSVGSLGYSPTSLAYLTYGAIKGGGALQSDPLHTALDSVKTNEMAANRRKYLSVSPADGSATLTITDLVTGTGTFPVSLPFQRTYRSGAVASDRVAASSSTTDNGNDEFVGSNTSNTWRYSGPDSTANSHLGGGWNHNYNVTANYSADDYKAFGSETALDASSSIAALWSLMDAARTTSFANRLAMIFDSYWLSQALAFNSVVIDKGGQTEVFQRLPDGSFNSLAGSSHLVQSGESQVNTLNGTEDFTPVTLVYTGKDGDTIDFDWMHQNMHPYSHDWHVSSADPLFKANHWTFPDGTKLTFTYSGQWLATMIGSAPISCNDLGCLPGPAGSYPWGYVLTGVSNNRGRSLAFTVVARTTPVVAPTPGPNFNISTSFQITRVTDETGRHVDYALSNCPTAADGNPNRLLCGTLLATGPDSAVTKYTYNTESDGTGNQASSYRLNACFSPSNLTTPYQTLAYDDIFHTATVTDILGHATNYYPGSVTAIDLWKRGDVATALGFTSTSTFDRWNSLLTSTNPLGATTTYVYDNARRKILETAPEGNSSAFTYDTRSNLLSTTKHAKSTSSLPDIVTSSTYVEAPGVLVCTNTPTCNKKATATNGNGYVTAYSWDSASGLLTQVRSGLDASLTCQLADGNCPETDLAYTAFTGTDGSSFELLTSTTVKVSAGQTIVTSYAYSTSNKFVLQSGSIDPSGLNITTSFTFDALGNVTAIDGPRTDVTDVSNYVWDGNRRLTYAIQADPDGAGVHPRPATKYVWDIDGQLTETDVGTTTSSTGSDFTATLAAIVTYDAAGNKIRETTPTRVTQLAYDADDRLQCTAVRMNPAVFGALPSDACTLGTAGSFGPDRITQTTYDAASQILQEQRAVGTSLSQIYVTNTWTPNGKLASVTDADGAAHLTTYSYDGFDRLGRTIFADTSHEDLGYDADSNVVSRQTRAGDALTYGFDAMDRIATRFIPPTGASNAHSLNWTYTADGRVTEIDDSAGQALVSLFDTAGRQTDEIQTVLAAGGSQHVAWTLDAAGNRTKLTWPDGYYAAYTYDALNHPTTVTDSDGLTLATYTYDDLARRSSLQYAGTTGAAVSYTWSPENDFTGLTHDLAGTANDVTYTNSFSPAHQLAVETASNASYVWQPPATASDSYATVNALNQYPSVNGAALSWDGNGNLLTSNGWTYGHDPENRLMHARNADGSIDLTTLSDPLGRRTMKAVAFSDSGPTRFVHAGDAEIGEYTQFGGLIRRFIPGPAIDEYIAMVQPPAEDGTPGAKTFFHTNRQGSVIAMSDANGALVEGPYTYDAYGNCFVASASCISLLANTAPFRFTGQRFDAETGLYYYRARYYSAQLGRFIETDSVGYGPDINWYTYVHNDPTNLTDPKGLAGRGDLNEKQWEIVKGKQAESLRYIKMARAELAQLRQERRDLATGKIKTLSTQASATADAMNSMFGGSDERWIGSVDSMLANTQSVLADDGSHFNYHMSTAVETAAVAGSHQAAPNELYGYTNKGSNSVALTAAFFDHEAMQNHVLIHEPPHIFGALDYDYGAGPIAYDTRVRGWPMNLNADSYAAFVLAE